MERNASLLWICGFGQMRADLTAQRPASTPDSYTYGVPLASFGLDLEDCGLSLGFFLSVTS